MDYSTSGFSVLHYLLEFAQTHVYWVGDSIQPFYPPWPPSPSVLNLSQHQGLFQTHWKYLVLSLKFICLYFKAVRTLKPGPEAFSAHAKPLSQIVLPCGYFQWGWEKAIAPPVTCSVQPPSALLNPAVTPLVFQSLDCWIQKSWRRLHRAGDGWGFSFFPSSLEIPTR